MAKGFWTLLALGLTTSFASPADHATAITAKNASLRVGTESSDFIQTSAAGDRLKPMPPVRFQKANLKGGITVTVNPAAPRQVLEGIGGALTEASAYVLAHLPKRNRDEVLDRFFGDRGARFSMARTHIGACDFSVVGKYSYDDVSGDTRLEHFSIAPDRKGFPGTQEPTYALLPLIKDAFTRNPQLKLVASPWTAPAWMKDNQDWYGQGKGGRLLPEHYDTFARYLAKYLQSYRSEGVKVWAITPENEPLGNGGQWESMEFTASALRDFIGQHLGPQLRKQGLADVKVIQFDHNRDANAVAFSEAVLGDPVAATFTWGTGVHWYSATDNVHTEILDRLHQRFPAKALLHTEGCIDGIGTQDSSPKGAFLGWQNDAWWWSESATDWGYYWASPDEKPAHPRYVPVHRYARDLLEGLNHWFVGWIDWNLVLDRNGGPNHVNNLCAAPIMVDTTTTEVYVTPLYDVMVHFSRFLQPGDRVVQVTTTTPGLPPDAFHATAALSRDGRHLVVIAFNPSKQPINYTLQVGDLQAPVSLPANAIQSMRFPLGQTSRSPK
jgi:glucosylceramidase